MNTSLLIKGNLKTFFSAEMEPRSDGIQND